jgi:hypothetical protein
MTRKTRLLLQLGVVITCATPLLQAQGVRVDEQKATGPEQSVLASAKDLYASASYEAALLELNTAGSREDADQIDTYRALCQLALDRPRDAEQALEQIIARKPLYTIDDAQYSPRLVTMFRDVRRRALPEAAQLLYKAAKGEYEGRNYSVAAGMFKRLFSVLDDPDISGQAGTLADLRELADGFLKLSEQKVGEAAPAPLSGPAAAAAPSSQAPANAATAPRAAATVSYTALDAGVAPPVVIDQTMPAWRRLPTPLLSSRVYTGRIELVIDEHGAVETATLVKSIWPLYDPSVLQAAKHWHYQPAMKDGVPVRFRKLLDITVTADATHP